MNTAQRVAKNAGAMLFGHITGHLLAFFWMMYAARHLGPNDFGILSFALAFTGTFAVLGDLGLQLLTVREVAKDKSLAQRYLSSVSLIKIGLVGTTLGLIALSINVMGYPRETVTVVYILSVVVGLQAYTQLYYAIFQAYERMEFQAIGQILNAALILCGVMFGIEFRFTVVGFALLFPFASLVVLFYGLAVLRWCFLSSISWPKRKVRMEWSLWKSLLAKSWVFGIGNMFATIYLMIDRVILSMMKGDNFVGQYSAAYMIINALSLIPTAFTLSLFPTMASHSRTRPESLKKLYRDSVRLMYLIALPVAVGTTLLSRRIIFLIYGKGFLEFAPQTLNILIWAEALIFVGTVMSYLLVSIDKQKITLMNAGVGAALNVILNLLLIPELGTRGAAIATVSSDIYFALSSSYFLSKYGYNLDLVRIVRAPLLAAAIMGVFTHYCSEINLGMLIFLAGLIYFAVLFVSGYISKGDILLIKQVLRINGKGAE
jgi:O-antigen/teichoic acid export membrane protein